MTLGASRAQLKALCTAQDGRCFYCGREMTWSIGNRMATLDHYTPRALGGSNERDNLVAACYRCNQWKGDEPGPDFEARMKPGRKV